MEIPKPWGRAHEKKDEAMREMGMLQMLANPM